MAIFSAASASPPTAAAKGNGPDGAGSPASANQPSAGWPGFRGVGGNGYAPDASPPINWGSEDGTNVLWKTSIARHGMSSPIVAGNLLFLTAADHDIRQVLCFETNTGKLRWHHDVNRIPNSREQPLPHVLDETGFAAPTPVTDGRKVAAVFGTGELVRVNVVGERLWARHLGAPRNHYGHASSLTSYDELVIVQYDQKDEQRLLAFDFTSGKPVWEAKRRAISWSSPIVVDNKGRMELILANSKEVDSYDPQSGKHLWRVECLTGEVASSPAYADGILFVASEGATATAIDISNHDDDPKILWQWDESLPDAASLVATKDHLIIPTGFGVITCLAARSGQTCWEHEFDDGFSSSPILVKDRVYIVDISGTMQIFKMGKNFEFIGAASLGESVYATPAFVEGRIYIRGLRHLFCVEERK